MFNNTETVNLPSQPSYTQPVYQWNFDPEDFPEELLELEEETFVFEGVSYTIRSCPYDMDLYGVIDGSEFIVGGDRTGELSDLDDELLTPEQRAVVVAWLEAFIENDDERMY